jgi:hypothetical protein
MVCEDVSWIHLAPDKVQSWTPEDIASLVEHWVP